jgi:hypothetical protein
MTNPIVKLLPQLTAILCLGTLLSACQPQAQEQAATATDVAAIALADSIHLDVLKSPTCMCCGAWVEHASDNGFAAQISHPTDLTGAKLRLGIAPQYQSCHTAVADNGFVFEGHVPAKLVRQFLENPPLDALGLAVPGMPMGSPGMEIGDQFQAYDVLLLNKDGSASVYAHMASAQEQY